MNYPDVVQLLLGATLPPDPACWSWSITDEVRGHFARAESEPIPHRAALHRAYGVAAFTRGRCGICGDKGRTVEDHDHATGLVRGPLCRRCNTLEGQRDELDDVFARYRQRYPLMILGAEDVYWLGFGRGWADEHLTTD